MLSDIKNIKLHFTNVSLIKYINFSLIVKLGEDIGILFISIRKQKKVRLLSKKEKIDVSNFQSVAL